MSKQKDEAIYRKGWNDGFAKGAAAARFQLEAENAELRKHVKMPDEPLEIDEKDFYARAFIKWAIEEQPEVKRIKAENAKLRELVRDLYKDLAAILGDGLWMEPYESRMMDLEVDDG